MVPTQVGSRVDGLVSLVKDIGVHVVLGDGRSGRGHQGGGLGAWAGWALKPEGPLGEMGYDGLILAVGSR